MRRHFSIQTKLTLMLVGFTFCVLVATLLMAHRSYVHGFEEYVTVLESRRLSALAQRMAHVFSTSSGWSEDVEEQFVRLSRIPFHPGHLHHHGHPPPPKYPHPPKGAFRRRGMPHPTALFDTRWQHIAGDRGVHKDLKGITVAVEREGRVIGHVKSVIHLGRGPSLESRFVARQLNAILIIGSVTLLLAVLLAVLMARRLLLPIRQIIYNISELSAGRYDLPTNDTRRDEIGVLMRDVSRLSTVLEQTRSSRRSRFANISHELRTPLAIMTAELEALQDGVRQLDDQALESLAQEVARLRYLVDDLYELSMSQIGALSYVFEYGDLQEIVLSELDTVGIKDMEGLTLNLSLVAAFLSMDARRMAQLVRNLLSNALKYTDYPGQLDVSLEVFEHKVTLQVADSSPSVSREECAHLFEPLYRVDASRARDTGGAGLGLAICKNIADAHEGTITASPSRLGGICITVTFPVAQDPKT